MHMAETLAERPTRSVVDASLDLAVLPTPAGLRAAIGRAHRRLGRPGPTLTGPQRVGVVQVLRMGGGKVVDPLDLVVADLSANDATLVRWMNHDAAGLSADFIDRLTTTGSDPLRLMEVAAVVATWSAIDHYTQGIGGRRIPLPKAVAGWPTREINPNARVSSGWMPTLGEAHAPTALAALPSEQDAVMDLHGHFYLTAKQVGEDGHDRELTRQQMEFVAARTSYMNECFY